jgi:hypothetical protein
MIKLKAKFKYVVDGTPPCINCITLGICKGIVNDGIKRYDGFVHTTMIDKKDYICGILIEKCSLLSDFVCLGIQNNHNGTVTTLHSVNRKGSIYKFYCPEDFVDDSLPRLSNFSNV